MKILVTGGAGFIGSHLVVVRVEPFEAIDLDLLLLWGGSRSASQP